MAQTTTVCLNMIVCNEGRIIRRLLDSVRHLVREYVIVDTGSTDDTVEQIRDYPLPGVVLHRPFDTFGRSRTFALEQARIHSRCEYLLLVDADMEVLAHHLPLRLTADAYIVTQKTGGLAYQNIRFLRTALDVACVGSTHEYYALPPGAAVGTFSEDAVVIFEHPDGGSKAHKFERDYRLLREEVQANPQNPRALFYLAQTCFDMANYHEAIECYEKRIALGGWQQEAVYSGFRIGLAYLALNQWDRAEAWMQRAHANGTRAEPLYYLAKALREQGDHVKAYYFLLQALRVPKPLPQDSLFIEDAVYDHLAEFERCVLWYYVHWQPELLPVGMDLSLRLLDNPRLPQDLRDCVLSNTVFYVAPLAVHPQARGPPQPLFPDECFGHSDDRHGPWRYSSTGFLGDGTPYTRLVNYYYLDDGTIACPCADGVVRTRLLLGSQPIDDIRNETTWHQPTASVKGLEDTRIFECDDGALYTLSASWEYARGPGLISQVLGKIERSQNEHTVLAVMESPLEQPYEKNWVVAGDLDHVIYRWYPDIWVGRIDIATETYVQSHRIPSPPSFLGMRGSTNGVFHQNLWWFVTHTTICDRGPIRRYTHRVIAMDHGVTEIRYVSKPFVFEPNADIEYCLGFRLLEDGTAMFAYSVRDRRPRTLSIPLRALLHESFAWNVCTV